MDLSDGVNVPLSPIVDASKWREQAQRHCTYVAHSPLAIFVADGAGLLGDVLRERFLVKDAPCGDPCPSRCSKVTVVRDGPYAGATSEGPEYETVYALGSSCGIYDLGAVIAADQLCDRTGTPYCRGCKVNGECSGATPVKN